MHLRAQAATIPSGVPPIPIRTSTSEPSRAALIAPAMSPSVMNRIRAPASRTCSTSSAWRGRSRMQTVSSETDERFTFAIRRRFSFTPAVMSITSAASGPTASFSM